MKIHYTKEEAFAEARARREAGETVKVQQAKTTVTGSGDRPAQSTYITFFVQGEKK